MEDNAGFSDSEAGASHDSPWPGWIRGRIVFDELPSTQDEAKRLVAAGYDQLPFFVQALLQTAGRGRGENRWSAGEGALAFTLAFEPGEIGLAPSRLPTLSIATALAVCESLQRFSPAERLGIKWPNDVYAAGRKLGGILVETVQRPSAGSTVALVGIGINIDNEVSVEATVGRAGAIRLADLAGQSLTEGGGLAGMLTDLLESLGREYQALARQDAQQVERWNARHLLAGRRCEVTRNREAPPLIGVASDVDADGALTLVTEQGTTTVRSGSVVAWERT